MGKLYDALVALPSKSAGSALGLLGAAAALWPGWVESTVGERVTADEVWTFGVILLALSAAYFALLWWLKPSGEAQFSSSTHSNHSHVFSGTFNAPVILGQHGAAINGPEPQEFEETTPGVNIHLIGRIHYQNERRRKYIVTLGDGNKDSAQLYLTASNLLAFCVWDKDGQPYSIEASMGRSGVPYSDWVIVSAELAIIPRQSRLRLLVNGDIVGERPVPGEITFSDTQWVDHATIAANPQGCENGMIDIAGLLTISRHLSDDERTKLYHYWDDQWKVM